MAVDLLRSCWKSRVVSGCGCRQRTFVTQVEAGCDGDYALRRYRRGFGDRGAGMSDAVIENPVVYSPYAEPERHFRFTEDGITNQIVEGRRPSSYFVPIPRAKTRGKQLLLPDSQWTQDRVEENP